MADRKCFRAIARYCFIMEPPTTMPVRGAHSSPALIGSSELVNFSQLYPHSTTVARKNNSIVSNRDCCEDCRLQVIRRLKTGILDFGLLRILPVIIGLEDISVAVHQSHHRVDQSA